MRDINLVDKDLFITSNVFSFLTQSFNFLSAKFGKGKLNYVYLMLNGKKNEVAIPTAPVRRLQFAIHTIYSMFHRFSIELQIS